MRNFLYPVSPLSSSMKPKQTAVCAIYLCSVAGWIFRQVEDLNTSLGSSDMKSLWNCGSITCIMCFTWLVSHLSINSSRANSLSGPLHACRRTERE
uniref:Uncharacterized protein n=1 Tax=Labrus bergylta TaxID=56723 RepID=A0A3Q3G1A2_9LABR